MSVRYRYFLNFENDNATWVGKLSASHMDIGSEPPLVKLAFRVLFLPDNQLFDCKQVPKDI